MNISIGDKIIDKRTNTPLRILDITDGVIVFCDTVTTKSLKVFYMPANKMLNYVSEELFNDRFSGITRNVDGKLYVMQSFGYSVPYINKVDQTKKISTNKYHTTVFTMDSTFTKTLGQYEIDFTTKKVNGKEVLDVLEDSVG